MFSSLSFLQADRSLVCNRCFFIPVEAVSPPNCVSQIYFLKEHYTLNSLAASCLPPCVFSKLDACRIKVILYINPVLHGCQCFVLKPQVNVKVDSKQSVMKYPFETCKISFVLSLGFRYELLFIFLLGPIQIPFFVTPFDGLPLIVSAFTFGNCNGHFGLSVLEINP